MAKNLDKIFEECLERVFRGESIESCLMRYPGEAADLEPLLRTALGVTNRAAKVRPDQEFKARARMQLQGALYTAVQPRPQEKRSSFSWQRSWAFALSAVVLLLFGGVGTAFASANAMPDEPLYEAKMATEQVQLAFTFSEENKVALYSNFAQQRAQEIEVMADEGKTDYVISTAAKLSYQMEKAESAIKRLEAKEVAQPLSIAISLQPPAPAAEPAVPEATPAMTQAPSKMTDDSASGASANETVPRLYTETEKTGSKKVERAWENFNHSTSNNLVVLERVLEKSPDEAKPALTDVINRAREIHERTLQYKLDTKPEPNSHKPEKENRGNSNKKPKSTPSGADTHPLRPNEIKESANDTTQPSDNKTPSQYTPGPATSSQSTDAFKKPGNTDDESDNNKSSGPKYNNSFNSK